MKKFIITIIILVVSSVVIYTAFPYFKKGIETDTTIVPFGEPTFEWVYASFESGEIPRTKISLTATYPNGAIVTKEIDTIEGGCNAYPEPDKDVYVKSEMIICYYAGFGRYYKIISTNGEYLVKRKEFEEATDDYNPPKQDFATIEKF